MGGIALIAFTSCNMGYKTTKSGMKYKVFSGKAVHADTVGVKAEPGDIIKFQFKYTVADSKGKDSILGENYSQMPGYQKVDTSDRGKLQIQELFPLLKSGDSVEVAINVDSILKMIPAGQAPSFLRKGGTIHATLSVLNVFKSDSLARLDVTKEQTKEEAREAVKFKESAAQLDKYIKDKGIKAIKTPDGIYIALETPGDISIKADSGMQASVLYTGKLLDGKIFDTNLDSTFIHYHPGVIKVDVGQHRTIEGWDKALPYFGKGAKGTIYIPAGLAYGARAQGSDIPAYSNLVFDIQVTDITKSEAPKPQMQMTPEMQKQMQEAIQKQMQAQKEKSGH